MKVCWNNPETEKQSAALEKDSTCIMAVKAVVDQRTAAEMAGIK